MLKCAQLFIDELEAKNLNFDQRELDDGDCIVSVPYNGKNARCIFSGDNGEYLSMYLQYENVPKEKILEVLVACNELNCKYKWISFYVDKDNDIMLHDDAILCPETAADEAFELMVRMLKIMEDIKPVIMKAIYA